MKTFFSLLCLSFISMSFAQQISIIPKPVKTTVKTGNFTITENTVIIAEGEDEKKSAAFLNDYLEEFYGLKLPGYTKSKKPALPYIRLSLNKTPNAIEGKYTMKISHSAIDIIGNDAEGVFYGIQTLIQLLPAEKTANL
ncbi:MAG: glycoside hydrolase family 20 zincin-like fold domain-containing protein [Bacteroidota bacterium]